jgi:nitrogen regulatory protein PII 2
MKMIVAIIRNECLESLKNALESLMVKNFTIIPVFDKGSFKSTIRTRNPEIILQQESDIQKVQLHQFLSETENREYQKPGLEPEEDFSQKTMFIIISGDETVHPIVQTFIRTNQSGQHGDGKIFICPIATAIAVGSGDHGDKALS